jgi:hypothetical protein
MTLTRPLSSPGCHSMMRCLLTISNLLAIRAKSAQLRLRLLVDRFEHQDESHGLKECNWVEIGHWLVARVH